MKEIKNYELSTNKINNLNICLLADIHYSKTFDNNLFNKIINDIKQLNPDYVMITGDIVDKAYVIDLPIINNLYIFLSKLGEFSKVIISYGNHDVIGNNEIKYNFKKDFYNKINSIKNVKILKNEYYIDKNVRVFGYFPNYRIMKLEKVQNEVVEELENLYYSVGEKYNIFLCHNPYLINQNLVNKYKIDLILSGHTHGGLVFKPLDKILKNNSGLISPNKKLFPKKVRGLQKYESTYHIITEGITKLSESAKIINKLNFIFPYTLTSIKITKK
jgi:hypothetical protein